MVEGQLKALGEKIVSFEGRWEQMGTDWSLKTGNKDYLGSLEHWGCLQQSSDCNCWGCSDWGNLERWDCLKNWNDLNSWGYLEQWGNLELKLDTVRWGNLVLWENVGTQGVECHGQGSWEQMQGLGVQMGRGWRWLPAEQSICSGPGMRE